MPQAARKAPRRSKRMRTRSVTASKTKKKGSVGNVAQQLMFYTSQCFASFKSPSSHKCDVTVELLGRMAKFVGPRCTAPAADVIKEEVVQQKSVAQKAACGLSLTSAWQRWRCEVERSDAMDTDRSDGSMEGDCAFVLQPGMGPSETQEHLQRLLTECVATSMGPLLATVIYHKQNRSIFNQPVDPVVLNIPDYFGIIAKPMDLGTVRQKLEEGDYATIDAFAADVRLVFNNATEFNPDEHPVHRRAVSLLAAFNNSFSKAKTKFLIAQQKMLEHQCDLCHGGMVCPYCLRKCLALESPALLCDSCHGRIPLRTYFYCLKGSTKSWCPKCFSRTGVSSRPRRWLGGKDKGSAKEAATRTPTPTPTPPAAPAGGTGGGTAPPLKALGIKLSKRYNGTLCAEPWVSCALCSTYYHQACALHNAWQSDDGTSKGIGCPNPFVCISCRSTGPQQQQQQQQQHNGGAALDCLPRAKNLPRTHLSDLLEERIGRVVHDEYQRRGDTSETAAHVASAFSLRVVSCTQQSIAVPPAMQQALRAVLACGNAYPEKIAFKSRSIWLFQRVDGVDVALFSMYVSEFGPDAPPANRGAVYMSYIDSVNYMRPRFLRTPIYHAILSGYLADVKRRGYTNVHIWACPPTRGTDYIFHKHPKEQRTPGWERLRTWYNVMLQRAHAEGSVIEVSTLYRDHFITPEAEQRRPGVPPPYLPMHHWLKQLGAAVRATKDPATAGPVAARLRSSGLVAAVSCKPTLQTARRPKSAVTTAGTTTTAAAVKPRAGNPKRSTGAKQKQKEHCRKSGRIKEKRRRRKQQSPRGGGPTSPLSAAEQQASPRLAANASSAPPHHASKRNLKPIEALSKMLAPMAQRLLVVRLQPLCFCCGEYISGSDRQVWRCVGSCCAAPEARKGGGQTATNFWRQGRAEPVIPARALLHSPEFFCRHCVETARSMGGGGKAAKAKAAKAGRLRLTYSQTIADKLAKTHGHGPLQLQISSGDLSSEQRIKAEQPARPPACAGDCQTQEHVISCMVVDKRASFLTFCTGNHFQFDTLRHAKFSSMMLLHLLSQSEEECRHVFVHYCNFCRLPIIEGQRWCCSKCPDFDVCIGCKEAMSAQRTCVHPHPLSPQAVCQPVFQLTVEPDPQRGHKHHRCRV